MESLIKLIARQDWVRVGIRDHIVRAYCNPDRAASFEFEADFFGLAYPGNLNSFIDWNVYFYGAYEREYLVYLKHLVKGRNDPVFVDVGANVGNHTLFMSQYCREVHAFEPNPNVRRRLHQKLERNAIAHVVVHGVGLGERNEDLTFFTPGGANQGTGSFVADHDSANTAGPPLRVVQADDYFVEMNLNRIDLIKIDVEGFERQVLAGMRRTIEKYRPLITMEYSDTTMNAFANEAALRAWLPADYEIRRIVCNTGWGVVFNRARCRLEDFRFDVPGDVLLSPRSGVST